MLKPTSYYESQPLLVGSTSTKAEAQNGKIAESQVSQDGGKVGIELPKNIK